MYFYTWTLIFVSSLSVVSVGSQDIAKRDDRNKSYEVNINKLIRDDKFSPIHRIQKRGVFHVIVTAVFTLAKIGNAGINLWTALEDGCNIHGSICTDRNIIKDLEANVKNQSAIYEEMYYSNRWRYLHLRQSMVGNKYILYYINKIVKEIQKQKEIVSNATNFIEVDSQNIQTLFRTFNDSFEVLKNLVGPIEYKYEMLKEIVKESSNSPTTVVTADRFTQYFLDRAVSYINKVISQAEESDGIVDTDVEILDILMNDSSLRRSAYLNSILTETKDFFNGKAKYLGSALKVIGTDVKTKFGDIKSNVKTWWKSSSNWQQMKIKFQDIIFAGNKVVTKLDTYFKGKVKEMKYSIKNYKFDPASTFFDLINIIKDTIETAIGISKWDDVRDTLAETRKKYENYTAVLSEAIEGLKQEENELENYWANTIANFKTMIKSINSDILNVSENSIFSSILDLDKTSETRSHSFYDTDFNNVTEKNLEFKQEVLKDFLKINLKNMTELTDKLSSHFILIKETKDAVDNGDSVTSILQILQTLFMHQTSTIKNDFGLQLQEKDVVCSVAMTSPMLTEYEYYPLADFRVNSCHISDAEFTKIKEAVLKREDMEILIDTVSKSVPDEKTIDYILHVTKSLYSREENDRIKTFGNTLTDKDIVCTISELFQNIDEYNGYFLSDFRPNCSQVSSDAFTKLKEQSVRVVSAKHFIESSMTMCNLNRGPSFCICPSNFVPMVNLSLDIVTKLINQFKPGTTCEYKEDVSGLCYWVCN